MSEELKCCPFCRSECVEVIHMTDRRGHDIPVFYALCRECYARGPLTCDAGKPIDAGDVVKKWNRRIHNES